MSPGLASPAEEEPGSETILGIPVEHADERAYRLSTTMTDGQVPWWAVALLDLAPGTPHSRVRSKMEQGVRPRLGKGVTARWWETWVEVIEMARARPMQRTLEEWRDRAYNERDQRGGEGGTVCQALRAAGLRSPRAFVQIADLRDDEQLPIVLKDFHVRTLNGMRKEDPFIALLPYEHGKSYLSSIVVPLQDWAEWPDATECRIYLTDKHIVKWITRLMAEVEFNENLQRVYPWIRRPVKGDPGYGRWSTVGFAIGGRRLPDRSFEPLTARQYTIGTRYARTGCDDWVNSTNAASVVEQDKMFTYLTQGALTMRQKLVRQSSWGTRWGTLYVIGTLFHRQDINYRAYHEWRNRGWKAVRYDVYPHGNASRDRGEVLWPEFRPAAHIAKLRNELGDSAFDKRLRNLVEAEGTQCFPLELVRSCEHEELGFGEPPEGCKLLLAFDPGSGRLTKHSRNPAWVLYGERELSANQSHLLRDSRSILGPAEILSHVVSWNRLAGFSFTRQCDALVEIARAFHCPVAVEDNNVQTAYADYLRKSAPDVRVITHTTGANKRDARDGVESLVPAMESGRLLIHTGSAPQDRVLALRREMSEYPQGRYSDLLMALWIGRYQSTLRRRQVPSSRIRTTTPAYALRVGAGIYR